MGRLPDNVYGILSDFNVGRYDGKSIADCLSDQQTVERIGVMTMKLSGSEKMLETNFYVLESPLSMLIIKP